MATVRKFHGSYQVRWMYFDRIEQVKKQVSKSGFKTAKEAKDYGRNMEALNQQNKLYLSKYTVESFLKEWITQKSKQVSKKTAENYRNAIDNHIVPKLGKKKLNELKKIEYQKFIHSKLDTHSVSSVKLIHSVMSNAMNYAVDNEIIDRNITLKTDLKKSNNMETPKTKFFTKNEIVAFLNTLNVKNGLYDMFFILVANSGMRAGEALALTWGDINFISKEITINKSVKRINGTEFEIGKPKTESSIRKIGLDDYTLAKLSAWKSEHSAYLLRKKLGKSEYVFTTAQNRTRPPHYRTILKNFNIKLDTLGLPHIGIHGLRHTHAVMLLEAGASIKYVAERLGHSNVEMTLNVYVHLTDAMKQNDMNKFANHLGLA